MKISAIIAEYNPFHNGHKHLIDKAKENSDAVIAVMSGSFVQRGDAAIFDKWTRAKAALLNGVDLVIELPAVFSSSTAERFSYGAIDIITKLNCVDFLYFGSESGDIDVLKKSAKLLSEENSEISAAIKENLSKGLSFPLSRQLAYKGLISKEVLSSPNNILALEYLKALIEKNSTITPVTVKRSDFGYHSTEAKDSFASAAAIRRNIFENTDYSSYIPYNVAELYENTPVYSIYNLENTILYKLRTITPYELSKISDVTEGLENRLIDEAKKSVGIDELIENVSTKRYPKTRIMRILISVLLGITKEITHTDINYARILGFNTTGRKVIKLINQCSDLKVITKTADYENKENDIIFRKDLLSTDIASLASFFPENKKGGKDFTFTPIFDK